MKRTREYIDDLTKRIEKSGLGSKQKVGISRCIKSIAQDVPLNDINAVCDLLVKNGQILLKAECCTLLHSREHKQKIVPLAAYTQNIGYRFPPGIDFDIDKLTKWGVIQYGYQNLDVKTFTSADESSSSQVFEIGRKISQICEACTSAMTATICDQNDKLRGLLIVYGRRDFESKDVTIIELLAELTSIILNHQDQLLALKDAMETIVPTPKTGDTLVSTIEIVCDTFGYDSGIIYLLDSINKTLSCKAMLLPNKHTLSSSEFKYRILDKALVTHVYNSNEPYFSPNVENDKFIDKKGIQYFQIKGSLISVPIRFNKQILGVLICWSSNERKPRQQDLEKIQPLAKIIGHVVSLLFAYEQRESIEHTILETLPAGLFVKDTHGRFMYANSYFCSLLGLPMKEIIGKTDKDFYPASLAAKYRADDQKAKREGFFEDIETNIDYNGLERIVHVVKVPLEYPRGHIVGIQGIFLDVTRKE